MHEKREFAIPNIGVFLPTNSKPWLNRSIWGKYHVNPLVKTLSCDVFGCQGKLLAGGYKLQDARNSFYPGWGFALVLDGWKNPQNLNFIGIGFKRWEFSYANYNPCPLACDYSVGLRSNNSQRPNGDEHACDSNEAQNDVREIFRRNESGEIGWRFAGILVGLIGGISLLCYVEFIYVNRINGNSAVCWSLRLGGGLLVSIGFFSGLLPIYWDYDATYGCENEHASHRIDTVTQKLLTLPYFCNTVIAIGRANMANVLSIDKQVAIVSALAEGSSIRAIERMTGVHRDTIMRLGVRIGQGCAGLLDCKMRALPCKQLQFDEIWGFIGKKERHVRPDDDPTMGDVWTFCAIDPETKIVPSFKVGKRDNATAQAFVSDVASRMANRVQISSDALWAYVEAIENTFGGDVDFAQIIKTYTHDDSIIAERKFSAPEVVTTEKKRITGSPNMRLASTSHIERLNGTTRLHMRRLTRLTYAFSKKRENFEAATALHFAYYNFVKRHISLRCTPAMASGIERDFWTVGDLVEAAA
jgi:IS1 family transposase